MPSDGEAGAARNAIILYKEYPHIDFVERAEELVTIIVRTIRGEIRPVMSLYDCRMIELVPTTREPIRSFVDRMSALEGKENVLSVSLAHGFQQADVPEIGTRVLVITDDAKAAGDALATRLGEEFRALKGQFAPPVVPLDQALDQALASTGNRPSVIADSDRQCRRGRGLGQHQHHPPPARAWHPGRRDRPGLGPRRGRLLPDGRRWRNDPAALRRQERRRPQARRSMEK